MIQAISTFPFTASDLRRLSRRSHDLVLASTNVDEDLHFSTLYLESTLAPPPAAWRLTRWYSEVVAVNEAAVERYYLHAEECAVVSAQMSDLVLSRPCILVALLREIERRSARLESVFPPNWLDQHADPRDIGVLSDLYQRHLSYHRDLYNVARLPEALDRGTGTFTSRLLEIIDRRSRGAAPPDALTILSEISRPSVFRQEQLEFAGIADALSAREADAVASARTAALAAMALAPRSRDQLLRHRRRWSPLFYHGYGARESVPLYELAARLREVVRRGKRSLVPPMPSVAEREALASALRLSALEQECFRAYGLLGWTKALRRWHQLKNFRRLDRLLESIARALDCAEWDLRLLLPGEVLAWLRTGQRPDEAITARAAGAILWYENATLRVTGLPPGFTLDAPRPHTDQPIAGDGVVAGRGTGQCVLAARAGAAPPDHETGGASVLVLSQLDSDHVWMLPFYEGLVVEEHGASAHVSIIAREIGIPTVAGARDATRLLAPGEPITVDGDQGVVIRAQAAAVLR